MPGTSSRDRFFSAPTATNNLGFSYSWSDSAVITGNPGGPITGAWLPTVNASGNYSFFNTGITGSQTTIPPGVTSWNVFVESGAGYINGVLYTSAKSVQGGGYDGSKRLASSITVGCTGSAASPSRMVVSYEA